MLGNVEPSWGPVHCHGISEANEAVDLFALPAAPSVDGSPYVSNLLQDDTTAQPPMQLSRFDPTWNTPTTCPIESGPERQAAVSESDSFWVLPNPTDDGSRQHTGTQSRYNTEQKLLKNREAQRRFRQRHKVPLCCMHVVCAELPVLYHGSTASLPQGKFEALARLSGTLP